MDGDEWSNLNGGLVTTDNLNNVTGGVTGSSWDGDEMNSTGIKFSFDE